MHQYIGDAAFIFDMYISR